MDLKEYQKNTLDLLAFHEKAVSELYQAYGKAFIEDSDFWISLSKEEIDHANWIYKIKNRIGDGIVYFNEGRFNTEPIQSSLEYIKKEIIIAKNRKISAINALSVAFHLEDAFLEKNFFEVFEGDSVELKHTLLDLSEATKKHREIIKNFLEKKKNN